MGRISPAHVLYRPRLGMAVSDVGTPRTDCQHSECFPQPGAETSIFTSTAGFRLARLTII